ncbi:MAG TPA: hypothetical protein VHB98_02805, partial [Chloroflexota bacterium]|nr:hypothetical protein [Chloroflexota bacterium]
VPIIPDTVADLPAASAEIDDETAAQGAVDALMAACKVMVARVKALRTLKDGTQIVSGLIDLIRDLDERYAHDWGVVRRNGLAPVLDEVRDRIPEGDRFILESLEDERGGLTAEVFLRDLRTIAAPDRPRMVSNYAGFLLFVLQCILRQYLVPLQHDPARLRDVSQRLEYLVEGVRETLLARISGLP